MIKRPFIFSLSHPRLICCLLLTIFILIVYGNTLQFDFVHYDDHVYITDNPGLQSGLTLGNIRWALTSLDAGFWHPLTWLSLMLDFELYGLNAGGYHWTNVIFHIMNTILLFMVLERMTGYLWRSCLVAALFALHPLHVESVAWVAARKDVLSTFFLMLVLQGYVYYAARPGIWRYLLVTVLFILGLMSKAMLVTLPFVLLLLDWWPLGRFGNLGSFEGINRLGRVRTVWWLIVEKAPLLLLSAAVSVVTVIAEQSVGALPTIESFSLDVRVANALVSYVLYIGKTFWPVGMAVFYPHPGLWPLWAISLSVMILAGITLLGIRWYRAHPYFAIGWFWYLGTLVPVIGLVQVGAHGMADRYTYVPLIGLFIVIVWGCADIFNYFPGNQMIPGSMAVVIFTVLSIQSYVQTQYWRNARQLFQHAIEVTKDNYIAYNNLGAALARQGMSLEAINRYREALRIKPEYTEAYFNMGAALADQEKFPDAVYFYQQALQLKPDFAEAHNNLAIALARQGRLEEAIRHFTKALTIRENYQDARNNLKIALQELKVWQPE